MTYQEYVFLPRTKASARCSRVPLMLEVLITGDESLFAVFEEYNSSIIDDYIQTSRTRASP